VNEPYRSMKLPRAGRLIGIGTLVTVLTYLALQIVGPLVPARFVSTLPQTTFYWLPDSAPAMVREGELRIAEGDFGAATRAAIQALQTSPVEGRALQLLAKIAERQGELARANGLMQLAAQRSLRDHIPHAWLFHRAVAEGEFTVALRHADIVLRRHWRLRSQLLQSLIRLASDEGSMDEVIKVLVQNPPWRSWFLREFARGAPSLQDTMRFYDLLQASPQPPTESELAPYLERIVTAGHFEHAFRSWKNSLPPERRQHSIQFYNSDFRFPVSNLPFDWIILRARGVATEVVDHPDRSGRVLQIRFDNAQLQFRHVRKLMLLAPGIYRLSGKVLAHDLRTPRGLHWKLVCADGRQQMLAETANVAGTTDGWIEFEHEFHVPKLDCHAQWLRLELAADAQSRVESGVVWYDSMMVTSNPVGH